MGDWAIDRSRFTATAEPSARYVDFLKGGQLDHVAAAWEYESRGSLATFLRHTKARVNSGSLGDHARRTLESLWEGEVQTLLRDLNTTNCDPVVLAPVPSAGGTSNLMAASIGDALTRSGFQVQVDFVGQKMPSAPELKLVSTWSEREVAAAGAWSCAERTAVDGTVVVVDDVIASGTSARQVAALYPAASRRVAFAVAADLKGFKQRVREGEILD